MAKAEPGAAMPDGMSEAPALPRKQIVLTMAGVMLALFLAALDQTVVSTAMPQIISDLGGFSKYTWVTTAYLLASTTAVPIVGRLTDMYGRKWFLLAGTLVFLLGSVLAGVSQTMGQLIAFRAVQGLGGGVILALSFIVIADLFSPKDRGRYQGYISGVFGMSSVVGPTMGGFLTDSLSWRWVFFINIPIGLPLVALLLIYFPNIRPSLMKHKLDYLGVMALALTVVPLMLALTWGGVEYAWTSVEVVGSLVFSGVMLVALIYIESKAEEPIIPLSLFKDRVVSLSYLSIFFTGFAMFGAIIFVPLFFQGVLGKSATSSGSFLTPMMLGTVTGAFLGGQGMSRLGGHYRQQGLAGLGIMGLGAALVATLDRDTNYVLAVCYLIIMGFGMGITFPTFTIAVQNAVQYRVMGIATSATQFFRTIGGTLGLAIMGSVMVNRFSNSLLQDTPQPVKDAMAPGTLDAIAHNPQALVSDQGRANLAQAFEGAGEQGPALQAQLLDVLKDSLGGAINEVFIIAVGTIAVAWLVTLFIREIPLRGRSPAAAPGGQGAGPRAEAKGPPRPVEGPAGGEK